MQSTARLWQAASVDGIDSQDKVIVEIKCGVKSYQYSESTGEVSPYYYGQLQHILAVSGFSSIDYFCYTPGNKEILLNICRDDAYIKRLIVAETNFCNLLVERGAKIFGIAKNGNDYSSSKRVKKITYPHSSGDEYVGDFVEGKRTGKGTYTWPDGREYVGDFVDDKLTGKGTHTWPSGDEYVGDFVDDMRTGKGTYTWDSGIQYIGNFVEGVMEGKGICIELDGTKHEGKWKSGISIDLQEKLLKSAEEDYFKIKEKMYLFRKKWFFEKKLWEQYFSEKKITSAEKKCRLMEKKLDHLLAEYDSQVEFGVENFMHTYKDLIPCIGSIESVEKTWNRLIREGAQCRDVLMAEYLEANEFLATCHSELMSESKVDDF